MFAVPWNILCFTAVVAPPEPEPPTCDGASSGSDHQTTFDIFGKIEPFKFTIIPSPLFWFHILIEHMFVVKFTQIQNLYLLHHKYTVLFPIICLISSIRWWLWLGTISFRKVTRLVRLRKHFSPSHWGILWRLSVKVYQSKKNLTLPPLHQREDTSWWPCLLYYQSWWYYFISRREDFKEKYLVTFMTTGIFSTYITQLKIVEYNLFNFQNFSCLPP